MSNDKYLQMCARIMERIKRTMDYCAGVSREEFMNNVMLQEACVFNVLQVGELAARAIDYAFDRDHPSIPWRQMRGMRNRIVHDYDGVRLDTVWDTINHDFPILLNGLTQDESVE